MKKDKKTIVLASKSPRRIEMLRENGYDPIILPANIEETIPLFHGMEETVMFISLKKALNVKERLDNGDCLILSADTIVYKDDEIMGKPKDREDAFRILSKLKNTYHFVATGVTLIDTKTGISTCFSDVTKVYFKDYTDLELDTYLDTDEPYDKAGAYGIQGSFKKYVDHYEGDFKNVMGLPWYKVKEVLNATRDY